MEWHYRELEQELQLQLIVRSHKRRKTNRSYNWIGDWFGDFATEAGVFFWEAFIVLPLSEVYVHH